MHNAQVNHTSFFESFTRSHSNGYLIIDAAGKIIFADQSAGPLKNLVLPENIRELFQFCRSAFEDAFSTCLASGQSQARLRIPPPGGSLVGVDAYFFLCPIPGNAFQVMMSLQPAAALLLDIEPAAQGNKSGFKLQDSLFIKSQTLAQIGNYNFDYASALVEWTPAMFQIYRLPETPQGLSFLEFLERMHPEDRALFLHQSQQAKLIDLPLKMDIRIFRGDNTLGFIQLTAQLFNNEAGEIAGVFGTVVDITPYKDAECQLRQALTTVEKVMNHSPDMLLSIDSQGLILHVNKASEKIMGYPAAETIGHHYGQFIDPQDLDRTIDQLAQVRAGFHTHSFQNHCIRKDGSQVPIFWSAHWSEEEQNYFCVGRDATDLRRAQYQIMASEERFRLLAENGSDMMCILSPRDEYTFVSGSACRILGYQPEEFLTKTPLDFIHPDDLPMMQEHFEQIRHTQHLALPPYRFRAANGDWRWMETIITNYLDHPFIQGFATTCRDITERRLGELKIKESEQRYKSLFEHHPDPVYSLDLEGQFVAANRWVRYLTGYDADTILGKNFRELIIPDLLPETIAHFSWSLQGYARTYKTAVSDPQGRRIDLEVTNIPIIIDGQVTGIYGIAKDITQFQKARQERRQLTDRLEQKNHNLEQFAYIVSHNLRAPVANILGLTNLFNHQEADQGLNAQVIANLQKSAENLDTIIHGLNQILSNRFGLNQPREMVDLADLLTSIQNTLGEDIIRSQAVIQADFTEVAAINTIKSFLHNILLSLIRHATQYHDPERPLLIKIKASRIENKNCLTIQDNSLNLKRQKNGASDSFRRFDAYGDEKGLPVQLIRTQVEALGGTVEIDAEPATGYTFKLYLKH